MITIFLSEYEVNATVWMMAEFYKEWFLGFHYNKKHFHKLHHRLYKQALRPQSVAHHHCKWLSIVLISCKTYCWKRFATKTTEEFTSLSNLHYSRSQQECEDWSRFFFLLPQSIAQRFTTTHWLYFWSVLWYNFWNSWKYNAMIMTSHQAPIFCHLTR